MGMRLDDLQQSNPIGVAPQSIPLSSAQNLGSSNPLEYTHPPEKPLSVVDRLERGFSRTVESTPQVLGQALYYLGSNFDPAAKHEDLKEGNSFGDQLARMGLIMQERNKQMIAEKYPEKPDWIENLAGAGPMITAAVLGTVVGAPLETGLGLAVAGGMAAKLGAFQTVMEQGGSPVKAETLSSLIGAGSTGTMALNVGNFLKATGAPITQLAKGLINGYTAGFSQTAVSGTLALATGVQQYNGVESLKELMADAHGTGVTFAIWGGPLGAYHAMTQHKAIQEGYEKLGLSKSEARDAAKTSMAKGMAEGIKHANKLIQLRPDELARTKFRPVFKIKPVDETGSPRPDALDEQFVPTQPTKNEALTLELEKEKQSLGLIKEEKNELKQFLAENKSAQKMVGKVLKQFNELKAQVDVENQQKLKDIGKQNDSVLKVVNDAFDKAVGKLDRAEARLEREQKGIEREQKKLDREASEPSDRTAFENRVRELEAQTNEIHKKFQEIDTRRSDLEKQRQEAIDKQDKIHQTQLAEQEKEYQKKLMEAETEVPFLKEARLQLERLETEAKIKEERIKELKEDLAPKVGTLENLSVRIKDLQRGYRKGQKATLDDAKFVQSEFNRLIDQSDLSADDKAKFRKGVPLTVDQFTRELPDILRKMKVLEERAERRGWLAELKAIKLKDLPIDYQDHLKPIIESFDFTNASRAKIMARGETIRFFREKLLARAAERNPELIERDDKGRIISPLSTGEQNALDEASRLSVSEILYEPNGHEKLRAIYEAIMATVHEGKMKGKYLSNQKQRNHEKWVADYLKKLETPESKARLSSVEKSTNLKNRSLFKKMVDVKNGFIMSELHSDMLFYLIHAEDEHQTLHEAYQNNVELREKYVKLLNSIHSKGEVGEAYDTKHDLTIELGNETRTIEKMDGSQLLKTYAQSFDEKSIAHIENTYKRPGDTQATAKKIVAEVIRQTEELFPKQTKSIREQFEYFRGQGFDDLNAVVRELEGRNMSKVDFYDPLIGLEDRTGQAIEQDMKLGVTGMQGRAEVNSGLTKTRVKSELAIKDLDYYGDLMKNLIARSNYITMAPVIRDMNMKFYDPRVMKSIRDNFGDEALNAVHGLLKDLAAGGSNRYSMTDRVLSYARSAFVIKAIGLNFGSMFKVASQLSPAADYVGKMWIQKAVPDYLMNRAARDAHIDANSLMMKNMYLRQERDMELLIHSGTGSDLAPEKLQNEIGKIAMFGHLQMDMIVRRATWLAQEQKMLNEMPDATREEINAACDMAVRWTHPMGGTMYLPPVFRGNEIQKGLTTFHSATNRNFNLLVKANVDKEAGKLNYLGWIKKQIGIGLIPAAILAAISLHRAPSKRELALEYLNQTTGSEIYLGYLTQALISGREASATMPALDFITDFASAVGAKKPETRIEHGLGAVDDLAKTPLSNLFKDVLLAEKLMKGKSIAKPHEGFMHDLDKAHSRSDVNSFIPGGI